MALAVRCPRGHSYIASDIISPGDPGGCPVCRMLEQVELLERAAHYASLAGEPDDVDALLAWANKLAGAAIRQPDLTR